jgi:hypothetical protein
MTIFDRGFPRIIKNRDLQFERDVISYNELSRQENFGFSHTERGLCEFENQHVVCLHKPTYGPAYYTIIRDIFSNSEEARQRETPLHQQLLQLNTVLDTQSQQQLSDMIQKFIKSHEKPAAPQCPPSPPLSAMSSEPPTAALPLHNSDSDDESDIVQFPSSSSSLKRRMFDEDDEEPSLPYASPATPSASPAPTSTVAESSSIEVKKAKKRKTANDDKKNNKGKQVEEKCDNPIARIAKESPTRPKIVSAYNLVQRPLWQYLVIKPNGSIFFTNNMDKSTMVLYNKEDLEDGSILRRYVRNAPGANGPLFNTLGTMLVNNPSTASGDTEEARQQDVRTSTDIQSCIKKECCWKCGEYGKFLRSTALSKHIGECNSFGWFKKHCHRFIYGDLICERVEPDFIDEVNYVDGENIGIGVEQLSMIV